MFFIERGPSKNRLRVACRTYEEARKYFENQIEKPAKELWDKHSSRWYPIPNLRKDFSQVRSEDDYIIVEN